MQRGAKIGEEGISPHLHQSWQKRLPFLWLSLPPCHQSWCAGPRDHSCWWQQLHRVCLGWQNLSCHWQQYMASVRWHPLTRAQAPCRGHQTSLLCQRALCGRWCGCQLMLWCWAAGPAPLHLKGRWQTLHAELGTGVALQHTSCVLKRSGQPRQRSNRGSQPFHDHAADKLSTAASAA